MSNIEPSNITGATSYQENPAGLQNSLEEGLQANVDKVGIRTLEKNEPVSVKNLETSSSKGFKQLSWTERLYNLLARFFGFRSETSEELKSKISKRETEDKAEYIKSEIEGANQLLEDLIKEEDVDNEEIIQRQREIIQEKYKQLKELQSK